MRYIFKFPDIGEGLDEGTIVEWLVKKGQKIASGDSLVTMETDKVVTEIPSPKSGTLVSLYGKEGETIHVGDALVEIEIEGVLGEDAVAEVEKGSDLEAVKEEGAGVVGTLEIAGNAAVLTSSNEGMDNSSDKSEKSVKRVFATPVSRAMAKDLGIDIKKVIGTGPAGRVMKNDILTYASDRKSRPEPKSSPHSDETPFVEVEPMSQIRKTIAKNMIQSKHNAAHMTVFEEVEISELDRIRKKYKDKYAPENVKLTYLAFIIKAVALSLKKFKSLNSEMDIENSNMIYKKYYNIGIAVDTEKGLLVPHVKNADKLSIIEIAKEIQALSEKARDGKLSMDEMKDGTFTVTSYGSIGGIFGVPVINYPQAGILGIGRISKQPIVKNDKLDIGHILPLSLSVDHRIADGGETSRFLNSIMAYLAEPVTLLFD
ncbi:MAG: 2-oxo acid dehydrogenase subunit E2 [Bacteroidetes bacterium]|jgi:pyruvate dehydrogenase E2 component (dihydrolipoamide acetyltransferase)|nr:2-oxo acid dehydrogenase subunit E2 [Bacteroidota bacterium]MBT6688040.1 2-oxo acid dehydrogenase subunit E2 [Bacteroidota bacterium]MBT7145172.1 2-oxo acid dehydrogenase subunit E2 [Bacteroidota bacterium]MBT7490908.1 2-oxo acid dehydrogenase subunit E2 [Bacteroidota bacterium]